MGANIEIFSLIFLALAITFLIFKSVKYQKNDQNIIDFISKHYENEELSVEGISKLKIAEKIKYGVPLSSIFTPYYNSLGITDSKRSYARKVELTDKEENTYTKYVELVIDNSGLISFNEFDSYDI